MPAGKGYSVRRAGGKFEVVAPDGSVKTTRDNRRDAERAAAIFGEEFVDPKGRKVGGGGGEGRRGGAFSKINRALQKANR